MIAASSIQDAGSTELPRVLLANDHPAMLALTADALAGECLVVGLVPDGFELLAEAERLCPDVIVLDITMPRLDGIDSGARSGLPASSSSASTKTPTHIRRGGTGAEGDYLHNLHAKANEPPETFRPFIPKAVISVTAPSFPSREKPPS